MLEEPSQTYSSHFPFLRLHTFEKEIENIKNPDSNYHVAMANFIMQTVIMMANLSILPPKFAGSFA